MIAYIIIFFIILTPHVRIKGMPSFRLEQVVVILFSIYVFLKLIFGGTVTNTNHKFPLMYSFFSVFIVFSILIGSLKGINVIFSDFYELYKIYIYLGIYFIFSSLVETKEDKIKIVKFMIICLIVSVLISVQQYFNFFNLNEKYVPIIAPTQYETLVNNYPTPRVIAMTANPNEYAVMPGIGAILSWAIFLVTREKKNLIFLIIFVIGVLMTLSRSGFAFMAIGIIMFTIFYFFKYSFRIRKNFEIKINLKNTRIIILAVMAIIIFAIIIFIYLPKDLTWRLIAGFDLKVDSSFQARLSNWQEHLNYFKISPFFGLGPAKSIEYEYAVDNEWLLFLKRYGIIGTIYFVLSFVIPFIKSKDKFFKLVYFSVLLASAAYMIVVNIYSSFQVMPLVIILATLTSDKNQVHI